MTPETAFWFQQEQGCLGKSPDYGKQKLDEYTERDYHKLTDEIKPDWEFSGAVQDLRLLVEVGVAVANGETVPEWKEGSEFKSKRARK